jgi:multidrug efflux pump subunit AcrB
MNAYHHRQLQKPNFLETAPKIAPVKNNIILIVVSIIALCLGFFSIHLTPKEEELQIVVPMADIYIKASGASPKEIEDVEYVYSISTWEMAIVTVRFFVGKDREDVILKLHNKIQMSLDRIPSIVTEWQVKPVEIDDVPIVTLTLFFD